MNQYITSGIKKGLFGGEGFVLQSFRNGTALLELDSSVKEIDLAAAKNLKSMRAVLRFLNQPSNMTLKQ